MKNSSFIKHAAPVSQISVLFKRLQSGDRSALAEAITLTESRLPEHRVQAAQLLRLCLQEKAHSARVAVSGIPGVGKSTFIEALGLRLIEQNHKVAVLAVDPSSQISGGSILGDKTRMEKLSVHPSAFIRPTAAAGHLGGVARATRENILLCEASGFDIILVETVGVGQSEAEARYLTDLFLLLTVAGTGDELQGIKRGIMELPDAVFINKADNTDASALNMAKAHLQNALHLMPVRSNGIIPEVGLCDALSGKGIQEAASWITETTRQLKISGIQDLERRAQELYWFDKLTEAEIMRRVMALPPVSEAVRVHRTQITAGTENSFTAAEQLIASLSGLWSA